MRKTEFGQSNKRQALMDSIRTSLVAGEYKPGDKLPSQRQMCETYGIAPNTVREAIASLVQEGLLLRYHGMGTFVAEHAEKDVTIALIAPHLGVREALPYTAPYADIHSFLWSEVEKEAQRCGAHCLLYLSHNDVQAERENLLKAAERRPDGMVVYTLAGTRNRDCLEQITQSGIPVVVLDIQVDGFESDCVVTDNLRGAYQAVKQLLDSGFRRILHVSYIESAERSSSIERLQGYRLAMSEAGIDTNGLIHHTSDSRQSIGELKEYLSRTGTPVAAFAAEGPIGGNAWRAMAELGFAHDDVAIACFDPPNTYIPEDVLFVNVIQPIAEMGAMAVQLLFDKIQGYQGNRHVTLKPEIHVQYCGKRRERMGGHVLAGDVEELDESPVGTSR
jgi:GntR family transcriptional regulator, arabinose operon transcriptional repressor